MLKVIKVSKKYTNGPLALKSVSLNIEKGIFGLLGPNGAGKTTLMRIICTRLLPTEGEIYFNGTNVISEPMEIRKILGYLPQEFGLYEDFKVEYFLNYMAMLKGIKNIKNEVEKVLEIMRIKEIRNNRIKNLSGGMKKRVGVAQSLFGDSKLIILDEPTTGLDPEEKNRFYSILSELSLDAVIILSTHIVSDVEKLAQKMAIIDEGNILWTGEPKTLQIQISDKIYEGIVASDKLELIKTKTTVVFEATQPDGNIKIRAVGDNLEEFNLYKVEPLLEDAYLWKMKEQEDL